MKPFFYLPYFVYVFAFAIWVFFNVQYIQGSRFLSLLLIFIAMITNLAALERMRKTNGR